VYVGDEDLCEQLSESLGRHGFHVDSIVFPAVRRHESRLRFNMNANHTRDQIDRLLDVMAGMRGRIPCLMAGTVQGGGRGDCNAMGIQLPASHPANGLRVGGGYA
jgi:hypothetical protein